ncbi:MAG: DNA translocase FtsK 4TM domain-containing protein [Candidatus Gracilibacteria bacterium]
MVVRRRSSTRRSFGRARARKSLNIKVSASVAREIWAIIYMVVAILTIMSIQGALGFIGSAWVDFLKPIFGWGIYMIPVVFMIVSLMMFFSKKIVFGASKILGIILMVISVLSILHLSVPSEGIYTFAKEGRYGGYVGFMTNFLLVEFLKIGSVAAAIIFVATFLISLILVFEVSIREVASFLIPRIKIEMVKDSKKKKDEEDDDLDEEANVEPEEILIHKSHIVKPDSVIYEDEEDDEKKPKEIIINENRAKKVAEELSKNEQKTEKEEDIPWEFPSLDLLKKGDSNVTVDDAVLMENAEKIKKKLLQFGIEVAMHEVNVGPTVIQYTLKPHEGVKLSKITTLKDDIALALAAEKIRIEAPIPGKSLVGIEVPNKHRATVYLREILESKEFQEAKSKLTLPLGRDVAGKVMIDDLETMPHLLIAGATGAGKSVSMNSFLISLLYQNSPKDLKMIMIDPKRVELAYYNNIPHLLTPVIQDPEKAAISLRWVVSEMVRRYSELSSHKVRNIKEFNVLDGISKMPRIVVVIDELAELMMAAKKEVEAAICRIAQMARAVGIHLIIATQRPSVDVITGLIKANIPARIAFAVASSIDSRTILDGIGAEDLLGKGDMLFVPSGMNKVLRIQGIFTSTEEIEKVTNRIKINSTIEYDDSITSFETAKQHLSGIPDSAAGMDDDELYQAAFELVCDTRKASASLLQRHLKVGYARAARLIDLLEENGIVGPADGAKPRRILIN